MVDITERHLSQIHRRLEELPSSQVPVPLVVVQQDLYWMSLSFEWTYYLGSWSFSFWSLVLLRCQILSSLVQNLQGWSLGVESLIYSLACTSHTPPYSCSSHWELGCSWTSLQWNLPSRHHTHLPLVIQVLSLDQEFLPHVSWHLWPMLSSQDAYTAHSHLDFLVAIHLHLA